MRKCLALLLLLCLLPLAGLSEDTPDETLPILGLSCLAQQIQDGRRVTFSFSLEPTGYLGSDRAALRLWSGLLGGVTAQYSLQQGEENTQESLVLTGPESTLLSLTRIFAQDLEWLVSPALSPALSAPMDSGLLEAVLGKDVSAWSAQGTEILSGWPDWRESVQPLRLNGSAEEGYAALVPAQAGKQVCLALVGVAQLGLLEDAARALLSPERFELGQEPMSLFWREDEAGRPVEIRIVADISVEQGPLWNASLTLTQKGAKNQQSWELQCTATRGEDQVNLAASCKVTHASRQVKRQYRWKADGKLQGAAFSLDLRQNDTNTYTLQEGQLSEKLTRSLTLSTSSKDPEVIARNRGAIALSYTEKGVMVSSEEDFAYEGSIEMECKNGSDTLLAGNMPFTLATEAPRAVSLPDEALQVDPQDAQDLEMLQSQGEDLLGQALRAWLAGMDEDTLKLLMPESKEP